MQMKPALIWICPSIQLFSFFTIHGQRIPDSAYEGRFNSSYDMQARLPGYCADKTAFDCLEHFQYGQIVCISRTKIRDGVKDCRDGSDEWCPHDHLRCGKNSRNCVPEDKFGQCIYRTKKKLCIASEGDPVPCREYDECVYRSWLRDEDPTEFDCLDESDEAEEMNKRGCNSTIDGSMFPEVSDSESEPLVEQRCFIDSIWNLPDFWMCFNNTARKALDKFSGTPICKCHNESCQASTDTRSFEFRGEKICGESNIYSEGLKDPQSWYYKSVAAIMLQAVWEIIEKSNINPKPELCFPAMEINKGSVLFGIQIECQNNAKACDAEELKKVLQSSGDLDSSAEMDKTYVKDISDPRCRECDVNAECTIPDADVTQTVCVCKKGYKDHALIGAEAGRNCTPIETDTTVPSTSTSTSTSASPTTSTTASPSTTSTTSTTTSSTSLSTTSTSTWTRTTSTFTSTSTTSTSLRTTTTPPTSSTANTENIDSTAAAQKDEPGQANLSWVIIVVLLAVILLLVLLCCLWWCCCGRSREKQTDQVKPIMMSPSGSDERNAWSGEQKVIVQRTSQSSPSLPGQGNAMTETHQVQAVIEDSGKRLVDTPTMWEEYQRGRLIISPTSSMKQSSEFQRQSVPVPLTRTPPSIYPTVQIADEENLSTGSEEKLVPDDDEYSRWKKEMHVNDDIDSLEPSLAESLGRHGHPNVPRPEASAANSTNKAHFSGNSNPS